MDADTRERILQKAQALFFAQGLHLSTLELANELGISKSTLYQAFPSKDALLTAVLDRVLAHWIGKIEVFASGADFTGDFTKGLEEISAFTREITPGFQVNLRKYHPEVFASFIAKRDQAFARVFDVAFRKYAAKGFLRPGVNRDFLLRFVLHAIDLMHDRGFVESSGMKTDEILSAIIHTLLHGVLAKN